MSERLPRVNVYTCEKCNRGTVTVDLSDGTTPFAISCRASYERRCDGMARSGMYAVSPLMIAHATHAWVRPGNLSAIDPKEYDHEPGWKVDGPDGMRDWVRRGCLLLRRLRPAERVSLKERAARLPYFHGRSQRVDLVVDELDGPAAVAKSEAHRFSPAPRRDPEDVQRELATLGLGRRRPLPAPKYRNPASKPQ